MRTWAVALAVENDHRGVLATIEGWPVDFVTDYTRFVARARAGLTQDAVAQRMGTPKSAISRLERAGQQTPSVGTLQRYARAVGCELKIELVPRNG